jgi:hypothetical protein
LSAGLSKYLKFTCKELLKDGIKPILFVDGLGRAARQDDKTLLQFLVIAEQLGVKRGLLTTVFWATEGHTNPYLAKETSSYHLVHLDFPLLSEEEAEIIINKTTAANLRNKEIINQINKKVAELNRDYIGKGHLFIFLL